MRNQNLEVPFIAFYRKEIIHPAFDINDLWRIYKFDEKWCQLQNRKNNMIKLFKKMRKYQEEKIIAAMDKPLDESTRILKDEDVQRLEVFFFQNLIPQSTKDIKIKTLLVP
jgi:transcription elongation factor SPT6